MIPQPRSDALSWALALGSRGAREQEMIDETRAKAPCPARCRAVVEGCVGPMQRGRSTG